MQLSLSRTLYRLGGSKKFFLLNLQGPAIQYHVFLPQIMGDVSVRCAGPFETKSRAALKTSFQRCKEQIFLC